MNTQSLTCGNIPPVLADVWRELLYLVQSSFRSQSFAESGLCFIGRLNAKLLLRLPRRAGSDEAETFLFSSDEPHAFIHG